MNLHKKCMKCRVFFPAKPLELKFYCEKKECQESSSYRITKIKQSRHISPQFFDIYDLDRPIIYNDKVYNYERGCRICGKSLLKKDGPYSSHKSYCNEHYGSGLWEQYNWGIVSKGYARDIAEKNKEIIDKKFNEFIQANHSYYKEYPKRLKRDLDFLTICEVCSKLCLVYDYYWPKVKRFGVINIHHKIPVHTLDKDKLHLIWDKNNLIALCPDCHNKQDHQLKTKVDPFIHFRKITEFLNEVN